MTKLYKNLSYATLSGANDFNFDAIYDLIGGLSFSVKKSILANRDIREKEDTEKAKKILIPLNKNLSMIYLRT